MSKKIFLILLASLLFLSINTATATENLHHAEFSKNYTITSTFDTEIGITDRDIGILTVHETINQGETNLHKKP